MNALAPRELRWNCTDKGCFRNLCPRLGVFDTCFPRRIGMSDIDGVVEINGRFLFLEWKSEGGFLGTGQRIMFERMTALSPRMTAIVVCGEPVSMAVRSIQVFRNGKGGAVEPASLAELQRRITAWAAKAWAARFKTHTEGEL
ncbi:MAG: hypothetical protein JWQ44_2944 [Chthoniobacter sp.]|nr:hypothetical protein [Chthoniobacter sp.]